MASMVYQKDNRSGITYAYKSVSYWDKEKKQSRAKRTLIGRVDPETKEVVPTDGRGKKAKSIPEKPAKRGPIPSLHTRRTFYGATYLLDALGEQIGITEDLKRCFPDKASQILSLAYYLILEDTSPLFRFEKWNTLHRHPYGQNIPSQRSSELFASITETDKQHFFRLQGKRRMAQEYWVYDITSVSSYSQQLSQIQWGKNKEHDPLPQLNLALVFGEQSGLPFYYRKLAGNIPDAKTLHRLLTDLECLGFSPIKLVLDRGFYSADNLHALYLSHLKFLIAGRMSLSFIRKELEPHYDGFRHLDHYDEETELYAHTVRTTWETKQTRPYKGDTLSSPRRLYVHYYFNGEQAMEEEKAFDRKLLRLREELETDQRVAEHEILYERYFEVARTPKRGIKASINEKAIAQIKRYLGFFVLLTNETMDAKKALTLYRNKDVAEKAFGNLKERLNMRRMLVSSEQSLEGKLFVQFIALIYLSCIKKRMQDTGLFKQYTLQGVLDQLDLIECFEVPGSRLQVGEILEKQKAIYQSLGVPPPSSL